MILRGVHLRAARVFLDWNQKTLARKAEVSLPTIQRMEASDGAVRANPETVAKVQRTLEAAGIEFFNADAPGVRLRAGLRGSET